MSLWISQHNISSLDWISSARIRSLPGDLYRFNFAIPISTSKGLGSGTNGSTVCIYMKRYNHQYLGSCNKEPNPTMWHYSIWKVVDSGSYYTHGTWFTRLSEGVLENCGTISYTFILQLTASWHHVVWLTFRERHCLHLWDRNEQPWASERLYRSRGKGNKVTHWVSCSCLAQGIGVAWWPWFGNNRDIDILTDTNRTEQVGSGAYVSDITILEMIDSNLNGTLTILTEDFCRFRSPLS
jgi:hypothetical protein